MAFKTFDPGVLTSSDVNTFLMRQAVIVCTAATRPASPSEGMTIYETDTDLYRVYDGSNWQRLVGYTETYTPTSNITLGNGTLSARYVQIGDFYIVQASFVWGSTSSFGAETAFQITAPTAIGSLVDGFGSGSIRDDSTGQLYLCQVRPISVGDFLQIGLNVVSGSNIIGGNLSNTAPFTWAAGDSLFGVWTYWRS